VRQGRCEVERVGREGGSVVNRVMETLGGERGVEGRGPAGDSMSSKEE
jgi:hypothetical protein